jgi:DNA-directed RNA polymerase specialized sigma24 family protein
LSRREPLWPVSRLSRIAPQPNEAASTTRKPAKLAKSAANTFFRHPQSSTVSETPSYPAYEAMDDLSKPPIEGVEPPDGEDLTHDEVVAAVDGLSPLDRGRLDGIERRHLDGTDFKEGDLLHAAICSALLGNKKCPRATAFIAFLVQSMRNIAGRRRKELLRQVPIVRGAEADGDGIDIKDEGLDPEDELIRAEEEKRAAEIWAVLEPLYAPDEQIQLVLLGWEEGIRGKKLRELVGVTQAQLDYIIKRIRRLAAKHYPRGWRS